MPLTNLLTIEHMDSSNLNGICDAKMPYEWIVLFMSQVPQGGH